MDFILQHKGIGERSKQTPQTITKNREDFVAHLCNNSDKMSPGEFVIQRFTRSDAQNATVTVDGELTAGLQTK